ncbi:glycine zipper family protein [Sediminibacterium ginsengisoli]|uniref:Uncharacterized protein n=1 Tax=Sediminibacterium ginsengisoli TaxID=413434 RepID=A0A1T4QRL5_9BACT|nr:glycine zipper family protein [Sediminibacterium ginsengisoli]SKA06429.1 hypothetical protein SAMN04488132_10959 [Sediminibacterium ginsengisoli]
MQPRKRIGVVTLLLIGLGLGYLIKNVKIGLIIGLGLGLLAGGLLSSRK